MINVEEAFYYKVLISCGIYDGYSDWLNWHLENEEPLSDIVLELSFCGSDNDKTIRHLHNYCLEYGFDEKNVCEKLRLFLKESYYSNKMSKEEVISNMYLFANNIEETTFELDMNIWGDMFYMEYYYSLALEMENFQEQLDSAFLKYLNDGASIVSDSIFYSTKPKKESFYKKVLKFFNIIK